MDIIYYTREEIERAREMDLLTYLRLYEPENLVHVGANVYSTREHDSLKISNGKWMWWSREFGGASALDYLIKVKGISFPDAMAIPVSYTHLPLEIYNIIMNQQDVPQ